MHQMLRQHQIRAQDIKPYVLTYDRKNPVGADEWATQEGMLYGPGMLIFVLEPAKRPPGLSSFAKPQIDAAPDLFRVKDLSCVVDRIENKSWVLNITPSAYELRFLDTLFREKAKKAIFDGLDLNYLIAKPRQPLTEIQLKELRQIANAYSDGGSRRSLVQEGAELDEPTRAILGYLGVDWSSQPSKQVIEIGSICHMLFAPDPGQEDPLRQSIRTFFTSVMSSEALSEGIPQSASAEETSAPAPKPAPTPAAPKPAYAFTQPEDYIEPESEPELEPFSQSDYSEDYSETDADMEALSDQPFPMATQEFGRPNVEDLGDIGADSEDMQAEGEIPSLPSWYLTTHDIHEMNSHAKSLMTLARTASAKSQNGDGQAAVKAPKEDFSSQFLSDYAQGNTGVSDEAPSEERITAAMEEAVQDEEAEFVDSIFENTGGRGSLETNPEADASLAAPQVEMPEPESTPSEDWDPVAGEDIELESDESGMDFDALESPAPAEKPESASLLSRLTGAVGQEAPPVVQEETPKDPLKPPTNLKEMLTADSEVFRVAKPSGSAPASAQDIFAQSSDSNAALSQPIAEEAPQFTSAPEPSFQIDIETPAELVSMEMPVPDFQNFTMSEDYSQSTFEEVPEPELLETNDYTQEEAPVAADSQEFTQAPGFFESPINLSQEDEQENFQDEWTVSDGPQESETEPVPFAPAQEEIQETEETESDIYEESPVVPWEVAPPEAEYEEEQPMLMPPPGIFQPEDESTEEVPLEEVESAPAVSTPIITPPPPPPAPVLEEPEEVLEEETDEEAEGEEVASAPIITPPPPPIVTQAPAPAPAPAPTLEPERPPIVTEPPPKPSVPAPTPTPPPVMPSRLASLAATSSSTSIPVLPPSATAPAANVNPAPAATAAPSAASTPLVTPPPPPPLPENRPNVEPKLMISESARFIAKLNQRIVEAESKLSSKSDQSKERLNKLVAQFVEEAEKLEKQREQNAMNLAAKATKSLERVADQLKSLIQETAQQAITEIGSISTNSEGEIIQLNQEILATLKNADQKVKSDTQSAIEDTRIKLDGHVSKRLEEYQASNALQQLEATDDQYSSRLEERYSRFEVRIKQEIQSILSSLERNVSSMNEEIEGSWDRASEKLLVGRSDFERTVNHLVRDCELVIEQRTKLAYIEKVLPKLLENKDIFRTMLTDMKKNFEEQADQTISSHIEGLEQNISSAKIALEKVVDQCVGELDEIGNTHQKEIENLFDTYNDRLSEMHTMIKIKLGEARKKIEENEEVSTKVKEYARTEEDPILSKERAKTRTTLNEVRSQAEQNLEATISTYCQTMEDMSENLQNSLTAKRNDWIHQVKQSSEDGLAQVKQAIQDAYQAIEVAKEKYME